MLVRIFQPTAVRRAFTLARMYEPANSPSIQSVVLPKPQKGISDLNLSPRLILLRLLLTLVMVLIWELVLRSEITGV